VNRLAGIWGPPEGALSLSRGRAPIGRGQATESRLRRLLNVEANAQTSAGRPAAISVTSASEIAVTKLYRSHAVGFIRLAVVILGDRGAAEDVVQEAFCGLYRRWQYLEDTAKALAYVRSAVINGCRTHQRSKIRAERRAPSHAVTAIASAEEDALLAEEHREVLAALRGLPPRQREALVLRFYLDLSEPDIAACMGISAGTVKSTTSRALATLGRLLRGNL
jgi:RNA polymerase sigma-70 factor (sigma-E family)